jgi:hypothetical protein
VGLSVEGILAWRRVGSNLQWFQGEEHRNEKDNAESLRAQSWGEKGE